MLERAGVGVYPRASVRELPPEWRRIAFEDVGKEVRVRDLARTGLVWSLQDVRSAMPEGPFDLVLCRNLVFTYFDDALQVEVLGRLRPLIRPGGFLVLGKHERLPVSAVGLQPWREHLRIFRRVEAPEEDRV